MNLVLCLERECNVAPTSTKSSCGASANVFSFLEYRVVQKKGTVLLSNSLAWPAVAGCSWAETFSQLSSISFAQPCIPCSRDAT